MLKNKNQTGHTIVEVVIAMFVFIVMLFLYASASNSTRLNRQVKNQDLALRIAESSMEDLKNTPFNSLPSSGSLNHSNLSLLMNSSLNLTMTSINPSLKQAEVVISWKDESAGSVRSINLTSLLSDKGI